jgi:hypothetical protein
MGYIVDLTVILDSIFKTAAGGVSIDDALSAINKHINSDRRDRIHREIRTFVTDMFQRRLLIPQKDLVLERIIEMIRRYCVPHPESG